MSVLEFSVGADPVPTYDYYGAIMPRAYPRSCEMRLTVRLRDYAESDRFLEYVQDYFQGHRGLARDAVSRELEKTKGDYLTALDEIEKLKKLVIDLSRYASPKGPEHFCGPLGGLLAQVEVETNLPEEVLSTPTVATIGGAKEAVTAPGVVSHDDVATVAGAERIIARAVSIGVEVRVLGLGGGKWTVHVGWMRQDEVPSADVPTVLARLVGDAEKAFGRVVESVREDVTRQAFGVRGGP